MHSLYNSMPAQMCLHFAPRDLYKIALCVGRPLNCVFYYISSTYMVHKYIYEPAWISTDHDSVNTQDGLWEPFSRRLDCKEIVQLCP